MPPVAGQKPTFGSAHAPQQDTLPSAKKELSPTNPIDEIPAIYLKAYWDELGRIRARNASAPPASLLPGTSFKIENRYLSNYFPVMPQSPLPPLASIWPQSYVQPSSQPSPLPSLSSQHLPPSTPSRQPSMKPDKIPATNRACRQSSASMPDALPGLGETVPPKTKDEIVGIQGYVCGKCCFMRPRIFIPRPGGQDIIPWDLPFPCKRDGRPFLKYLNVDFETFVHITTINLMPACVKDWVVTWLENNSNLIATEVPELGYELRTKSGGSGNSNGGRVGSASDNLSHSIPIKFDLYDEKSKTNKIWICEFKEAQCVTLSPADTGSWAVRVIKDGRTRITDAEIGEFLNTTRSSSFGFFKIVENKRTRIYFIALSKEEQVICKRADDILVGNEGVEGKRSGNGTAGTMEQIVHDKKGNHADRNNKKSSPKR